MHHRRDPPMARVWRSGSAPLFHQSRYPVYCYIRYRTGTIHWLFGTSFYAASLQQPVFFSASAPGWQLQHPVPTLRHANPALSIQASGGSFRRVGGGTVPATPSVYFVHAGCTPRSGVTRHRGYGAVWL